MKNCFHITKNISRKKCCTANLTRHQPPVFLAKKNQSDQFIVIIEYKSNLMYTNCTIFFEISQNGAVQ